jgi:hypothetical protein
MVSNGLAHNSPDRHDKYIKDTAKCQKNRDCDVAKGMDPGEAEVYFNWCMDRAKTDYDLCVAGFKKP